MTSSGMTMPVLPPEPAMVVVNETVPVSACFMGTPRLQTRIEAVVLWTYGDLGTHRSGAGKQGLAVLPGPAQQPDAHSERRDVDGELDDASRAGVPPDAVLDVVEGVHAEQVEAGTAADEQPEQRHRRPAGQRPRGPDQREGQPRVGERERVLELVVRRPVVAGDQRTVGVPGGP